MKSVPSRRPRSSVLSLALAAGHLEGAVVHRGDRRASASHPFSTALSLDPLTHEPTLVGREIRQHLDAAGVRERHAVVCLPATWFLSHSLPLPDLPEPDLASLLALEAERAFPFHPDELHLVTSRGRTGEGKAFATLIAIPREHLQRLEAVCTAARLTPLSFTLPVLALAPAAAGAGAAPTLDLIAGRDTVTLQITGGGGIQLLRRLERPYAVPGEAQEPAVSDFRRDLRLTLRQLADHAAPALRQVRVFGRAPMAQVLADAFLEAAPEGAGEPRVQADHPPAGPGSAAVAAGELFLQGGPSPLDLLPPRVHPWREFANRYSSRKLAWTGAAVGALAALVALAFLVQQVRLWHWRKEWAAISNRVKELETIQQQIRTYRPWFDASHRTLSVLRRVTEAFPEDGAVSARSVEWRQPSTVICTGTARDRQALLKVLERLRNSKEVTDVKVEQLRGRSPLEFTFNFQWGTAATP